jgi:acetylornithine deacetylase/succinyl-diaminopimelate desuccinylase-like protein
MSEVALRDTALERIHRVIDEEFPSHLDRCRDFLRQKSVSVTGEGIRETARIISGFIEEIGGTVTHGGDPAYPIVFGRLDKGLPKTLIIYGMYDVMPAEEPNWMGPPFGAEIHTLPGLGECVIARGAVNSKGSLCGVFNALKTMSETDGIPLNLIFTVEGEEEIGSPHFADFIRSNREALRGDGVVDFDFSEDTAGKVSMHLGLKGIVYLDLIARAGRRGGPTDTALHGSDSAWITSPVWRLVKALSSLTDEGENIKIDGIYENALPPSDEDAEVLKRLATTFNARSFLREMKSSSFKSDLTGIDLLKTGLYAPVMNINGLSAGYVGAGTKTVLPRKATAKIDIRFGPNLEPDEVVDKLRRHLIRLGFDDIEVRLREGYTWSKTRFSEPIVQKMIAAYNHHGVRPEVWPIATWAAPYFVFSRILNLPVVSGGLGHGKRQHVANEYMTVRGLRDFEKFVATFLYFLSS